METFNVVPIFPDTGSVDTIWATVFVIVAGLLGGLVKEIITNKGLVLPKISEGVVMLGFIGSIVIGAIAGWLLGDSLIGAFNAGLAGSVVFNGVVNVIKS